MTDASFVEASVEQIGLFTPYCALKSMNEESESGRGSLS